MKFLRLELENFRQYRDKVTINFSFDDEKNMNVIQGVNGAGKTNLMNALTWCLYGTEENLSKYAGKRLPIVNDAVLREMSTNSTIETRVQLVMISSAGEYTIFERKLLTKKDPYGNIKTADTSDFQAYQQEGTDMPMKKSTLDKNFLVNRILPKGVKGFFFFDGERLDEFFKEENSAKVKEAILDVSQLSLLDRAITHLEKTISSIRGTLRHHGTPQVDVIEKEITEREKRRDKLREEKKEYEKELKGVNNDLDENHKELINCNVPLVQELQRRRTILEKQLEGQEKSHKELKQEIIDKVLESGPSIYSIGAITYALNEIRGIARKGDLPPKMKDTFVKELLEKGECICGCDISQESLARQKVTDFLKEAKISEISEELTNLKFELTTLLKQPSVFLVNQNKLRSSMSKKQQEIFDTKNELKGISVKFTDLGIDVKDADDKVIAWISQLEIKKKQLDQSRTLLIGDIKLREQKISEELRAIEYLNKNLTKELDKIANFQQLNNKIKVANETYQLFIRVKQRLIDDIRKTIEQKTQEYFLSLIWKKGEFSKISIDEGYNVSVINRFGDECLGSLSAGERQVLALSFLAALREVSGFDAPIIIDTPLGRISKEPKENIASLLPKFLKGSQVTMLATDEEYNKGVREKLLPFVGKEYELKFDEQLSKTLVVPYVTV